jgi:hypothetical protein
VAFGAFDLKAAGRFASVEVRGMIEMPASATRDFFIAFALGSYVSADGKVARLKRGEVGEASVITPGRRPYIMDAAGIASAAQWRRRVRAWERWGMAHRCSKGKVCLFRRPPKSEPAPNWNRCLACNANLETSRNGTVKRPDSERQTSRNGTESVLLQNVSKYESLDAKSVATEDERVDEDQPLDLDEAIALITQELGATLVQDESAHAS